MFLAPRQRKTTVFTRFWASASKNHSIYSVLWPGPSKNTGIYAVSCMLSEAFFGCQRHKNIVNYTIFTRGQYQKIMKNWPKTDQKTPNKDLQNASANFTLFSPTPNPQKRENPSRLKDFRGGSAAPARPRVAKAMLSNHHRTASPDLSAYARQPARGPTMWAHFVAMLAYVGLCWSILRAIWAHLVARLAYVGLRLIHVEPKDPKNGNSKKNTVKRRRCWWSAAYLGAMLPHLGAMLAYLEGNVGPAWELCCPSLRLGGPILELCWPILGLCWPILGAMLPHLGAMFAHLEAYVGPCWPILSHRLRKMRKNAKSTKHRKTRDFLALPTLHRQGRRPLSPTERRETPSARTRPGGPWPD